MSTFSGYSIYKNVVNKHNDGRYRSISSFSNWCYNKPLAFTYNGLKLHLATIMPNSEDTQLNLPNGWCGKTEDADMN
jgi:hypothetical protein